MDGLRLRRRLCMYIASYNHQPSSANVVFASYCDLVHVVVKRV